MIPRWGRSRGGENDNPFQYSCLKNSIDRGAWWATVHGVSKNQTQLGDFHFDFPFCKLLAIFSLLSYRVAVRIKCQGILYIRYYYYLYLSKKTFIYLERKITKNSWVHPFQFIEMSTDFTEMLFVLKKRKKKQWTICAPWRGGMY